MVRAVTPFSWPKVVAAMGKAAEAIGRGDDKLSAFFARTLRRKEARVEEAISKPFLGGAGRTS